MQKRRRDVILASSRQAHRGLTNRCGLENGCTLRAVRFLALPLNQLTPFYLHEATASSIQVRGITSQVSGCTM